MIVDPRLDVIGTAVDVDTAVTVVPRLVVVSDVVTGVVVVSPVVTGVAA